VLLLLPPALSRGSLLYNDSIPKSAIVEDLLGVIDRNHKVRSAVSEKISSQNCLESPEGPQVEDSGLRKLAQRRPVLPSVLLNRPGQGDSQRFSKQFLERVWQRKSRGVIGAKMVHAARANLRSISRLIAP
jgi:hypothetical protein